jgi:hypothetical protein
VKLVSADRSGVITSIRALCEASIATNNERNFSLKLTHGFLSS